MPTARDLILDAIRVARVPAVAAPMDYRPTLADQPLAPRFTAALEAASGTLITCPSREHARGELALLAEAGPMLIADPDLRPTEARVPERLDQLETCVVSASVGVAENGAAWVTTAGLPHPAALTLCQHLVLVLAIEDLVADMHQAYARIDSACGYGLFISGPSKTADVEQCLVVGAHGARTLTCYLVG